MIIFHRNLFIRKTLAKFENGRFRLTCILFWFKIYILLLLTCNYLKSVSLVAMNFYFIPKLEYWNEKQKIPHCQIVVHRSSTNQSYVIIRFDDRFLNLVVDSDSIVSKIYMLNFVLWLFWVFLVSMLTKILQFYSSWFFLPSYWQTSGSFIQAYFWHSVNTHIWTSLLFIYFPE